MAADLQRPLMRYHGGKFRLAPWILSLMAPHAKYVEPYAGAASLLLSKPPARFEVLNDLSGEVVNLFRVIRDRGDELARRIELTPYAQAEFELSYDPATEAVEQARRTLVRCQMAFGPTAISGHRTGWRSKASTVNGDFARQWAGQGDIVRQAAERLRGVVIDQRDALDVMRDHDSTATLHFVDPPYLPEVRTHHNGKGAYAHEMTAEDHEAMLEAVTHLDGMVMVCGYESELYRNRLRDWKMHRRVTQADQAVKRLECLWMNFESSPELF